MKRVEYNCPVCDNDMDNDIYDIEMDVDCLTQKLCCGKCNATWREFYLLKYDGYAMNGKVYDEKGEIAEV